MNIHFILHADFERPGAIVNWIENRGFHSSYSRPFAGQKLPQPSDFDWLILMGGPQSPSKTKEFPYLLDEIALIQQSLASGKKVVGFCLGAQLIGEAFGAKTERSPHKEVGVFPVQLTEEGVKEPLLAGLAGSFLAVHWHNDMPGLSSEAKILAASEGCPRQIIRYSDNAIAFQCHLEPTLDDMKGMVAHCNEDLSPGRYVQGEEALLKEDFSAIHKNLFLILENLLSVQKVGAV